MYPFTYCQPICLNKASTALAQKNAIVLAGGQTLLPAMKQYLIKPDYLVDLSKIEKLHTIQIIDNEVEIGAMVSHNNVVNSTIIHNTIPALCALVMRIGDPQTRNRATIGGSIADNCPNGDYPAACLALDATIITNKRAIKADAFFTGHYATLLDVDEIITHIRFPIVEYAAYQKFNQTASHFALIGVMVARNNNIVRIAATGARAHGAMRVIELEDWLSHKEFSPSNARAATIAWDDLLDDCQATPIYRAHLISILTARAIQSMG